jgi:hypothetical protein
MSQFPADPHFSSVVLFLPFEGTDGDTTFVDASINNYPMSSSGANLGTTQVKFSTQTTSAEITGALGNSITTTASPLNETMSWTIETWIYPIAPAYGGGSRPDPFHPIAYQYSGGGNSDQGIYVRSNGFLAFYRGSGHTDATATYSWSRGLPGSPQLPIQFDEWTHVAVCYDVGSPRVMTAFINGNQCNELPAVINGGWFDSANPFRIGDWYHPSYSAFRSTANAHYSDYRISSFVRYTGNFRPPRGPHPTRGIATDNPVRPGDPYFDDVVVLLPFEGTNGATTTTTTTDVKGNAVTINGSGQIDTSQSAFPSPYTTSSYLCDGAATFSVQPLVDAGMATGDWTVEFWYRPDGTASVNDRLFQTRNGDFVSGIYIAHEQFNANQIGFGYDINGSTPWDYLSGGTAVTTNTWYHIALVRNGSDFRLYLDGTSVANTTYAGSIYLSGSDECIIGAQTIGSARANSGWIDNFRITSRARYTGDFRPPRGPFPIKAVG